MPISNEITKSANHRARRFFPGALFFMGALLHFVPAMAQEAIPTRADPCPMPSLEMANAPDDLAKVQADIDRYTLCVERAQLLQRLNDLALENQDSLLAGEGLAGGNPGMMLDSGEFEAKRDEILNSGMGAGQTAEQVPVSQPVSDGWIILSVFGSGDGLQARLRNAAGELAQVKQGETLFDGSVVSQITPTNVTLTYEGENEELRWVDTATVTQQ